METPSEKPPVFALLFMSMFGFIGLTLLIALWFSDAFSAPPLFFKLFASFIAVAFMCVGFGVPLSALKHRTANPGENIRADPPEKGGYKCPNCGAGLDRQEVSPSGDVKCAYCSKWYNIHARS